VKTHTTPDRRRYTSRRVMDYAMDGSPLSRVLFMAQAADVRVWCFPDGVYHFISDSGSVNFFTSDINTVDTNRFWPSATEQTQ
jgi:hypothetical protein